MNEFEVPQPIICSPFEEPTHHWRLEEGAEPEKQPGRRPAHYFYRAPGRETEEGAPTRIAVPLPVERGYKAFRRYACKMATGSGKTTVMGMLAGWSILNEAGEHKQVAVKVIDNRGNELLVVKTLP